MENPKPTIPVILDYASPRVRSPMRLGAISVIKVTPAGDGVDIVEKLTGQGRAIAAMVFTCFSIGLLGLRLLMEIKDMKFQMSAVVGWGAFYVAAVAGTILLMLAVIDSTWRRTILEARSDGLTLIFRSPFKTRRYARKTAQIRRLFCTSNLMEEIPIYEIRIEFETDLLRLFTGHPQNELDEIALKIDQSCRLPRMAMPLKD